MDAPWTNIDMLAWFSEDERHECSACGEGAVVTVGDALASFCLACGAVTVEGVPIEVGPERLEPEPSGGRLQRLSRRLALVRHR